MKCHSEYLPFNTKKHREYVHITPQVEKIVDSSGVQNGLALVSAMHITAGVYVNDNESGLIQDIDRWLEQLAPFNEGYLHHQTGEDNGDSHLKAILVHHQVILPVTNGKLLLGTWQRVFYAEFDGQRSKRVVVAVMGEYGAGTTDGCRGTQCRLRKSPESPGSRVIAANGGTDSLTWQASNKQYAAYDTCPRIHVESWTALASSRSLKAFRSRRSRAMTAIPPICFTGPYRRRGPQ